MEQMETERVVDVYGFVAQMRKQRNYMVQTEVSSWVSYVCTYWISLSLLNEEVARLRSLEPFYTDFFQLSQ